MPVGDGGRGAEMGLWVPTFPENGRGGNLKKTWEIRRDAKRHQIHLVRKIIS